MLPALNQEVRRVPILHQIQVSGNCYKVRLAARQIGFDLTRKPDFLSKNPNGRVPLLELDDGRCLPESCAILWYITNGTALQPSDEWSRAQALSWMFFEQYSHEPYIAVARRWLSSEAPEDLALRRHVVPEWHAKGHAALAVMEQHLNAH